MKPPDDPAVATAWPPPAPLPAPVVPVPDRPHLTGDLWLVVLPIRLFLAAGWARAGLEKAIDRAWWRGDEVRDYLATQHDHALPFMRPVMEHVLDATAVPVAFAVMAGELAIGVALAFGVAMRPALWIGVVLNVTFVLTGRVNPSAFYLVMQIVLLLALQRGLIGRGRRARRPRLAVAIAWYVTALAFTPFVRTMAPHHMIDDPALMLSFLAFLLATGQALAWLEAGQDGPLGPAPGWVRRMATWSGAPRATPAPPDPARPVPEEADARA